MLEFSIVATKVRMQQVSICERFTPVSSGHDAVRRTWSTTKTPILVKPENSLGALVTITVRGHEMHIVFSKSTSTSSKFPQTSTVGGSEQVSIADNHMYCAV